MELFSSPIKIKLFGQCHLFSFMLLLSSCFAGGSDCDGGPRGYCNNYVNCIDTFLLDSSITKTLPDSVFQTIEFSNNNGFVTSFIKSNDILSFTKEDLIYKSVHVECGSLSCYDYFRSQNRKVGYKADNVPFSFSYQLGSISTTDSYNYSKDSLLSGYGIASIFVNSSEFQLPFNRKNYKNGRVLDSMEINMHMYYKIHHIFLDSASIDRTIIKPTGIYYKDDIGLIAFYLTNGETWGVTR